MLLNMSVTNLLPVLLVLMCSTFCVWPLNLGELDNIFEDADCIEGQLSIDNELYDTSSREEVPLLLIKQADITLTKKSIEPSDYLVEVKESTAQDKNALNLINELAQRHAIDVEYILVAEEAPPHERSFKVRLQLGEERFEGVGRSIKEAKRAAASQAWSRTRFAKPEPPTRAEIKRNVETLTPTVHLNNIAAKLGMKVEYFNEPMAILTEHSDKYLYYSLDSSKAHGSYLNALNKSAAFLKSQSLVAEKRGGPYIVRVDVGDDSFIGSGWSLQTARHAAAERALKLFEKMSLKDAAECLQRGQLCNKLTNKSPISLVHELATKHQWHVSFDVVAENGPPHKRVFVMRCKLQDFTTDGEAPTKKAAKKRAAEAMIKLLEGVKPWDAISVQGDATHKRKKQKKMTRLSTLETAGMSVMDALGLSGIKQQPNEDRDGKKAPRDELLALGKEIGMRIQFSSFHDDDKRFFATLVSMESHLCYAKDVSAMAAEDSAALNAIKFIKEVGLHHIMVPLKKAHEPQIILVEATNKLDADRKY